MQNRIQLPGLICLAMLAACSRPSSPPGAGSVPSSGTESSPASVRRVALGPDMQLAQNVQESSASPAAEARARQEATASLPGNDLSFIQRIGNDGQSEEQAALYVASKTRDDEIRAYAARLGQEHGAANQQLRELAVKRNVEIPADPVGQLRTKLDHLRGLTGSQMNAYFLREFAVQAHMDTIALFELQEKQTRDKELKKFISEQLPKLRRHYEQGKALQGKHQAATTAKASI